MVEWKSVIRSRLVWNPPVNGDPRQFSRSRKWTLVALVAVASILPGFCSTIILPAIEDIQITMGASSIGVTLANSFYMLFMGIAPIFYSSISDHYGIRRVIYIGSMLIFTAASIGAVWVRNIWVLLVMRILQSIGISAPWSIGAGTIADLYEVHERGTALGIIFAGQFAGPMIGPLLGGFLTEAGGWEAIFWLLFALGAAMAVVMFFFMEESFRDEELYAKPVDIKLGDEAETPDMDDLTITYKRSKKMNLLAPLALLKHPFVLIPAMETGWTFGCMFAIENILPPLYTNVYGWSPGAIGLSFLSPGLGEVIGAFIGGRISDFFLNRSKDKRGGKAVPEDRLVPSLWPSGFILMPLSILMFGWPIALGWSIWWSIIFFGVMCFAMVQCFSCCAAYLVDTVVGRGASVMSASNLVRMILSCVLSAIANPMMAAVGPGWVCVLFAALNFFWMFLLVLLKTHGRQIRQWSGY
ncbi:hypothetical protein K450DRAFT_217006 [Umbelopsis ramanniana AG]|uniref:Major facilitator superfamily (MFS) profile domain-containing protein n=1 Tax=Umbelopsis ramanniana AG TaxID=1314678 RepID=A0AAD5HJQ7_UMBRA|nr:uncharacterized protein K450DRAFT_217006 [Umbelopsis ramanniana AG]KAI8584583.1 hypothetical protein K450DRAFT_217006 [Umbelopsis ramanniana AG]